MPKSEKALRAADPALDLRLEMAEIVSQLRREIIRVRGDERKLRKRVIALERNRKPKKSKV